MISRGIQNDFLKINVLDYDILSSILLVPWTGFSYWHSLTRFKTIPISRTWSPWPSLYSLFLLLYPHTALYRILWIRPKHLTSLWSSSYKVHIWKHILKYIGVNLRIGSMASMIRRHAYVECFLMDCRDSHLETPPSKRDATLRSRRWAL